MRLFTAEPRVSRKQQTGSLSTSSQSSSHTTPSRPAHSIAWSLLCFVVVLNSFLAFLSPSTAGGRALAAVEAGFCGDCQTFANAIGVCGGSFTPADIEVPTEYVLQKDYATCTCTAVMQQVLWTCAKCEFLAGKGSKGVPPKKHLTSCLEWGITLDAYNLPYKGVVAPGTTTDLGNGTPNPAPLPGTTTTNPQSTTGPVKPNPMTTSSSGGNGDGNKPSGTTSDSSSPSSSQDSLNGDKNASGTSSGPNTAAIGISVGIIGVAFIAGVMAVVMMKRRRRRRTPLDLDSSPALANFSHLEDNWEAKPNRPTSPPLPPAPVASAAPVIGRGNGRGGYGDGSVVGGYDAQYDGQYDQYDAYGHGHHGGYDAYGHGQGGHGQGGYSGQEYDHYRGGQYNQGGYGEQDAYQMHDYGYDQHVVAASKRPPAHGAPMDHKRP
ncbi:hypothetical protein KI688_003422 [Linnemannia hyalina]|uniref:Uncharacterized protein n=1 Tax=Linnemannia hyalina TaxID=64524 RepID=A0A9P7XNS7_9FUNG|nr:hypothetical protein KI688_003422 [Linnemannia hyalina]